MSSGLNSRDAADVAYIHDALKISLFITANPLSEEEANDQQSLLAMLHAYGLTVENVTDPGAALAAGDVGDIIVIPHYVADALAQDLIDQIVAYVQGGGKILLIGRTALSEALGLQYTGGAIEVQELTDSLNPDLRMVWINPEQVAVFNAGADDTVFTWEKNSQTPISIGRSHGAGQIIYVGTNYYDRYSFYGTKGHPYLLYHLLDYFNIKSLLSAESLDVYFEPGNYDLTVVYVEDLIRRWAEIGVKTVYCAAWHYWVNEETGAEWTFDYEHFIDICHLWGLRVYAWFAFPHVTQKFWYLNPDCREQTAGQGETYVFWRLMVNLQNPQCLDAVLQFMDAVLDSYAWDGINVAEIYYDYEQDVSYFTPMNQDVRDEYEQIAGFDPIEFFDPASPHYYLTDEEGWNTFLEYRTDLVTQLHETFFNRIYQRPDAEEIEVILTPVDDLHHDYYDLNIPEGLDFYETGVDLHAIVQLMNDYDFTLQVEDPWPLWSSNPYRYADFRDTYLDNFTVIQDDPERIFFDINIVTNAHNPLNEANPRYNYPTDIQTGVEVCLTLKNTFLENNRVAVFSENSVEDVDIERLKWVLAADATVTQEAGGYQISTNRTSRFHAPNTFTSAQLDGRPWPCWSVVDHIVLLPEGSHQLVMDDSEDYDGIKLVKVNCELVDAEIISGGLNITYDAPRQKAVLTIEAFGVDTVDGFEVVLDSQAHQAEVYSFYGHYHFYLPKGRHTAKITALSDNGQETGENGAGGLGCFITTIGPATLTGE